MQMAMIYPDYSQLELKVIAALANDEPMLRTFLDGVRIHTANARAVYSLGPDDIVTKPMEATSKTTVYTLNYGGTAATVYQRLMTEGVVGVTLEFCEKLVENWFKAHPALKRYTDEVHERAVKQRYLELPISGRRLTWWRKPKRQETANWPIQATGADIMDRGILRFSEAIDWDKTKIIGQIHDALLVETPLDEVVETCEKLEDCLTYNWPVTVGGKEEVLKIGIGFNISTTNWKDVVEYKTLQKVKEAYSAKNV